MDTAENKKEQNFKCEMCGSKSTEIPGTCCGAERKPVEMAVKCESCSHEHKSDGSCDCGCK